MNEAKKPARILVVDDEQRNRRLLVAMLEAEGWRSSVRPDLAQQFRVPVDQAQELEERFGRLRLAALIAGERHFADADQFPCFDLGETQLLADATDFRLSALARLRNQGVACFSVPAGAVIIENRLVSGRAKPARQARHPRRLAPELDNLGPRFLAPHRGAALGADFLHVTSP